MDLPGALSKEAEKMWARSRHREKRADGGRELSANLIAKSLSLRGVEEQGKDLGEKETLRGKPVEEWLGVPRKKQKCRSRTVLKKKEKD